MEMKNGTLPIQGISPRTSVSQIKRTIEKFTGIPSSQQLLSSVGRIMHDEFYVDDFNGLHSIYEDSTLDLCKSGAIQTFFFPSINSVSHSQDKKRYT